jgi:hypothetical protein
LPEYVDLVQRAVAAGEQSSSLQIDSRRIRGLAQTLRDADAGETPLVRCAWCGRLKIGDEWLRLKAIGSGQQRINTNIRDSASHGICPRCFDREEHRRAAAR